MTSKNKTSFTIESLGGKDLFEELEKEYFSKEFALKDLDARISSRVLTYWSEQGLLTDAKRKTDENHRFSFIELMWLKIILELRALGFSLDKIKKVKRQLLDKKSMNELTGLKDKEAFAEHWYKIYGSQVKNKQKFIELFSRPEIYKNAESFKYSTLHYLLQLFIVERKNTKLMILSDGTLGQYINEHQSNPDFIELIEKETFISIPIFRILLTFIKDEKNFDFMKNSSILNKGELETLAYLKSGKYDSITIRFKDQKPFLIERTEKIKVQKEARLSELLLKREYEKIEITTQDGDISYSLKTSKHLL